MSRLLDLRTARTEGLQGLSDELIKEERKRSRQLLSKSGTILARHMRNNLSKRGGPSRPGEPPARVTGALRDTVGKDRPRRRGELMSVAVGIGQGRAKLRRVDFWKAQGINVFEYALLHERGGFGADGRRYPARSFARLAEEQAEAEIVALLEAGVA